MADTAAAVGGLVIAAILRGKISPNVDGAEDLLTSVVSELGTWAAELRATLERHQPLSGDALLAMRARPRPSWRDDPSTARQVSFPLDLGATEAECRGLTKGEASDRIDQLLAVRDGQHVGASRGDAPRPADTPARSAAEAPAPPAAAASPSGSTMMVAVLGVGAVFAGILIAAVLVWVAG